MNYTSYVSLLASTMIMSEGDANFIALVPSVIEYAENRMYRELDMLATRYRDSSTSMTPGQRFFTLPAGFVVVEEINAITPSGSSPDVGTRNPVLPVSRNVVDMTWPSNAVTGVPEIFAMLNNTQIILGPSPGGAYTVEVIGTKRPSPLSVTNPDTPLTTYCPDAFFAASMVFASGWQRDYGSQADDPKLAVSWETQYQTLAASANLELFRQKIQSSAWSAFAPAPQAAPPR